MNFIYNIYNYCKDTLTSFFKYKEPIVLDDDIHYFFINTANIHNAKKLLLNRLNDFHYKKIKIYLLKSHTLKPMYDYYMFINDISIKHIKRKLKTQKLHLHTFCDAIDSFIEYNKIKNYTIFY